MLITDYVERNILKSCGVHSLSSSASMSFFSHHNSLTASLLIIGVTF